MAKQKVVSIEIELKDYEPIKFTMAEAKELYEQLDSLFGQKKVIHEHYRYDWWRQPYYTFTNAVAEQKNLAATTSNYFTVQSNSTGMKTTYDGVGAPEMIARMTSSASNDKEVRLAPS